MYDVQFFFEDNGQVWIRIQADKEIIYALGDTLQDAMKQANEILLDIKEEKPIKNIEKMFMLFSNYQCH